MKKIILGVVATTAIAAPIALAASANADVARYQPQQQQEGTATFTVLQPKGTVGQFDNVWKHVYDVTVLSDGSFSGLGVITATDGDPGWTEEIDGKFTDSDGADAVFDHVTFATVPVGGGATFAVDNAAMDRTTVPVETSWTANIIEFQIDQPQFAQVVEYKNHGQYVKSQGGGSDAAHSPIGMPLKSNKIK